MFEILLDPEFSEPPKEGKKQENEPKSKSKDVGVEGSLSPYEHAELEDAKSSSHEVDKSAEDLRRIEEIRRQLEERKQDQSLQREESPVAQNPTETVTVHDQQYTVEYVPKEEIYPAFGHRSGDRAVIRQDLSPHVKRFVREHELYHCQDRATWGGWLGREIRANVVPGLKDPVGLLATIWATISDFERIKFYLKRIKEGR